MNANLLFPKIESDVSIPEQLQQMKSYLFQFREQIELLLMNIDSDNISEKFKDDFSELVGSKIMNGKEMSQIIQSAGQIRLQVEELGGSVASLTLTTNGIYNQINDPENGILTELSILSEQISASVKFGVNYSGFNISASKLHLFTTGALQIDSGNFKVDTNGNVEVKGKITANEGYIGTATDGLGITSQGLTMNGYTALKMLVNSDNEKYLQIGDNTYNAKAYIAGSRIGLYCNDSNNALIFDTDGIEARIRTLWGTPGTFTVNYYANYMPQTMLEIGSTGVSELRANGTLKAPYWEDFDNITPGTYVLCGS